MNQVWVDGALTDVADARVSPLDHGLLTGDGVFETLRVYDGVTFEWDRHLDRLERSATALGLPVPRRRELEGAADAVLAANDVRDARLRITVTGGPSPLGSERGDHPPTVIVAAANLKVFAATETVVVVPWTRNERGATAGLKTISYAENVRALAFARERGAEEALFVNTRGELCEATGSNVFVVHDGTVYTPPEDSGCLAGVTRAVVIELCATESIGCEEVALPMSALFDADEAFLTSSTREVQGIASIDARAFPAAPGPLTAQLRDAFTARVEATINATSGRRPARK